MNIHRLKSYHKFLFVNPNNIVRTQPIIKLSPPKKPKSSMVRKDIVMINQNGDYVHDSYLNGLLLASDQKEPFENTPKTDKSQNDIEEKIYNIINDDYKINIDEKKVKLVPINAHKQKKGHIPNYDNPLIDDVANDIINLADKKSEPIETLIENISSNSAKKFANLIVSLITQLGIPQTPENAQKMYEQIYKKLYERIKKKLEQSVKAIMQQKLKKQFDDLKKNIKTNDTLKNIS